MSATPLSAELARLVRCPACQACGLEASDAESLACPACGHRFQRERGALQLLGGASSVRPSLAQRTMEWRPFVAFYERAWRPVVLRALGFPGGAAEAFVFRQALGFGDRAGPWLDLSCGPGTVARVLSHDGRDLVVGLDRSAAMLERAARSLPLLPNLWLMHADAMSLPLCDGSFGGCVNSLALHLYEQPERVLGEVLRILRPGGVYCATTLHSPVGGTGVQAARALGLRLWDAEELRSLLARVGFVGYDAVVQGALVLFRVRKP